MPCVIIVASGNEGAFAMTVGQSRDVELQLEMMIVDTNCVLKLFIDILISHIYVP